MGSNHVLGDTRRIVMSCRMDHERVGHADEALVETSAARVAQLRRSIVQPPNQAINRIDDP